MARTQNHGTISAYLLSSMDLDGGVERVQQRTEESTHVRVQRGFLIYTRHRRHAGRLVIYSRGNWVAPTTGSTISSRDQRRTREREKESYRYDTLSTQDTTTAPTSKIKTIKKPKIFSSPHLPTLTAYRYSFARGCSEHYVGIALSSWSDCLYRSLLCVEGKNRLV